VSGAWCDADDRPEEPAAVAAEIDTAVVRPEKESRQERHVQVVEALALPARGLERAIDITGLLRDPERLAQPLGPLLELPTEAVGTRLGHDATGL
jgi:hypothetical protein